MTSRPGTGKSITFFTSVAIAEFLAKIEGKHGGGGRERGIEVYIRMTREFLLRHALSLSSTKRVICLVKYCLLTPKKRSFHHSLRNST